MKVTAIGEKTFNEHNIPINVVPSLDIPENVDIIGTRTIQDLQQWVLFPPTKYGGGVYIMEDRTGRVINKGNKDYIINNKQEVDNMYLRNSINSLPILPSKNIIATVRSHITLPSFNIKQQVHHMQDIFVSMNTQELIK